MGIFKFILKLIAGFGIFYYGRHVDYIDGQVNVLMAWIIALAIWTCFWLLLDVAEELK